MQARGTHYVEAQPQQASRAGDGDRSGRNPARGEAPWLRAHTRTRDRCRPTYADRAADPGLLLPSAVRSSRLPYLCLGRIERAPTTGHLGATFALTQLARVLAVV